MNPFLSQKLRFDTHPMPRLAPHVTSAASYRRMSMTDYNGDSTESLPFSRGSQMPPPTIVHPTFNNLALDTNVTSHPGSSHMGSSYEPNASFRGPGAFLPGPRMDPRLIYSDFPSILSVPSQGYLRSNQPVNVQICETVNETYSRPVPNHLSTIEKSLATTNYVFRYNAQYTGEDMKNIAFQYKHSSRYPLTTLPVHEILAHGEHDPIAPSIAPTNSPTNPNNTSNHDDFIRLLIMLQVSPQQMLELGQGYLEYKRQRAQSLDDASPLQTQNIYTHTNFPYFPQHIAGVPRSIFSLYNNHGHELTELEYFSHCLYKNPHLLNNFLSQLKNYLNIHKNDLFFNNFCYFNTDPTRFTANAIAFRPIQSLTVKSLSHLRPTTLPFRTCLRLMYILNAFRWNAIHTRPYIVGDYHYTEPIFKQPVQFQLFSNIAQSILTPAELDNVMHDYFIQYDAEAERKANEELTGTSKTPHTSSRENLNVTPAPNRSGVHVIATNPGANTSQEVVLPLSSKHILVCPYICEKLKTVLHSPGDEEHIYSLHPNSVQPLQPTENLWMHFLKKGAEIEEKNKEAEDHNFVQDHPYPPPDTDSDIAFYDLCALYESELFPKGSFIIQINPSGEKCTIHPSQRKNYCAAPFSKLLQAIREHEAQSDESVSLNPFLNDPNMRYTSHDIHSTTTLLSTNSLIQGTQTSFAHTHLYPKQLQFPPHLLNPIPPQTLSPSADAPPSSLHRHSLSNTLFDASSTTSLGTYSAIGMSNHNTSFQSACMQTPAKAPAPRPAFQQLQTCHDDSFGSCDSESISNQQALHTNNINNNFINQNSLGSSVYNPNPNNFCSNNIFAESPRPLSTCFSRVSYSPAQKRFISLLHQHQPPLSDHHALALSRAWQTSRKTDHNLSFTEDIDRILKLIPQWFISPPATLAKVFSNTRTDQDIRDIRALDIPSKSAPCPDLWGNFNEYSRVILSDYSQVALQGRYPTIYKEIIQPTLLSTAVETSSPSPLTINCSSEISVCSESTPRSMISNSSAMGTTPAHRPKLLPPQPTPLGTHSTMGGGPDPDSGEKFSQNSDPQDLSPNHPADNDVYTVRSLLPYYAMTMNNPSLLSNDQSKVHLHPVNFDRFPDHMSFILDNDLIPATFNGLLKGQSNNSQVFYIATAFSLKPLIQRLRERYPLSQITQSFDQLPNYYIYVTPFPREVRLCKSTFIFTRHLKLPITTHDLFIPPWQREFVLLSLMNVLFILVNQHHASTPDISSFFNTFFRYNESLQLPTPQVTLNPHAKAMETLAGELTPVGNSLITNSFHPHHQVQQRACVAQHSPQSIPPHRLSMTSPDQHISHYMRESNPNVSHVSSGESQNIFNTGESSQAPSTLITNSVTNESDPISFSALSVPGTQQHQNQSQNQLQYQQQYQLNHHQLNSLCPNLQQISPQTAYHSNHQFFNNLTNQTTLQPALMKPTLSNTSTNGISGDTTGHLDHDVIQVAPAFKRARPSQPNQQTNLRHSSTNILSSAVKNVHNLSLKQNQYQNGPHDHLQSPHGWSASPRTPMSNPPQTSPFLRENQITLSSSDPIPITKRLLASPHIYKHLYNQCYDVDLPSYYAHSTTFPYTTTLLSQLPMRYDIYDKIAKFRESHQKELLNMQHHYRHDLLAFFGISQFTDLSPTSPLGSNFDGSNNTHSTNVTRIGGTTKSFTVHKTHSLDAPHYDISHMSHFLSFIESIRKYGQYRVRGENDERLDYIHFVPTLGKMFFSEHRNVAIDINARHPILDTPSILPLNSSHTNPVDGVAQVDQLNNIMSDGFSNSGSTFEPHPHPLPGFSGQLPVSTRHNPRLSANTTGGLLTPQQALTLSGAFSSASPLLPQHSGSQTPSVIPMRQQHYFNSNYNYNNNHDDGVSIAPIHTTIPTASQIPPKPPNSFNQMHMNFQGKDSAGSHRAFPLPTQTQTHDNSIIINPLFFNDQFHYHNTHASNDPKHLFKPDPRNLPTSTSGVREPSIQCSNYYVSRELRQTQTGASYMLPPPMHAPVDASNYCPIYTVNLRHSQIHCLTELRKYFFEDSGNQSNNKQSSSSSQLSVMTNIRSPDISKQPIQFHDIHQCAPDYLTRLDSINREIEYPYKDDLEAPIISTQHPLEPSLSFMATNAQVQSQTPLVRPSTSQNKQYPTLNHNTQARTKESFIQYIANTLCYTSVTPKQSSLAHSLSSASFQFVNSSQDFNFVPSQLASSQSTVSRPQTAQNCSDSDPYTQTINIPNNNDNILVYDSAQNSQPNLQTVIPQTSLSSKPYTTSLPCNNFPYNMLYKRHHSFIKQDAAACTDTFLESSLYNQSEIWNDQCDNNYHSNYFDENSDDNSYTLIENPNGMSATPIKRSFLHFPPVENPYKSGPLNSIVSRNHSQSVGNDDVHTLSELTLSDASGQLNLRDRDRYFLEYLEMGDKNECGIELFCYHYRDYYVLHQTVLDSMPGVDWENFPLSTVPHALVTPEVRKSWMRINYDDNINKLSQIIAEAENDADLRTFAEERFSAKISRCDDSNTLASHTNPSLYCSTHNVMDHYNHNPNLRSTYQKTPKTTAHKDHNSRNDVFRETSNHQTDNNNKKIFSADLTISQSCLNPQQLANQSHEKYPYNQNFDNNNSGNTISLDILQPSNNNTSNNSRSVIYDPKANDSDDDDRNTFLCRTPHHPNSNSITRAQSFTPMNDGECSIHNHDGRIDHDNDTHLFGMRTNCDLEPRLPTFYNSLEDFHLDEQLNKIRLRKLENGYVYLASEQRNKPYSTHHMPFDQELISIHAQYNHFQQLRQKRKHESHPHLEFDNNSTPSMRDTYDNLKEYIMFHHSYFKIAQNTTSDKVDLFFKQFNPINDPNNPKANYSSPFSSSQSGDEEADDDETLSCSILRGENQTLPSSDLDEKIHVPILSAFQLIQRNLNLPPFTTPEQFLGQSSANTYIATISPASNMEVLKMLHTIYENNVTIVVVLTQATSEFTASNSPTLSTMTCTPAASNRAIHQPPLQRQESIRYNVTSSSVYEPSSGTRQQIRDITVDDKFTHLQYEVFTPESSSGPTTASIASATGEHVGGEVDVIQPVLQHNAHNDFQVNPNVSELKNNPSNQSVHGIGGELRTTKFAPKSKNVFPYDTAMASKFDRMGIDKPIGPGDKDKGDFGRWWPHDDSVLDYDHFSLACQQRTDGNNFTMYDLDLINNTHDEWDNLEHQFASLMNPQQSQVIAEPIGLQKPRRVIVLHYTAWPDNSLPTSLSSFIFFYNFYLQQKEALGLMHNTLSPIMVHCKAGLGRTGSFITLDTMFSTMLNLMNRYKDYHQLYHFYNLSPVTLPLRLCLSTLFSPTFLFEVVPYVLNGFRLQRRHFVQNHRQYQFIFLVINVLFDILIRGTMSTSKFTQTWIEYKHRAHMSITHDGTHPSNSVKHLGSAMNLTNSQTLNNTTFTSLVSQNNPVVPPEILDLYNVNEIYATTGLSTTLLYLSTAVHGELQYPNLKQPPATRNDGLTHSPISHTRPIITEVYSQFPHVMESSSSGNLHNIGYLSHSQNHTHTDSQNLIFPTPDNDYSQSGTYHHAQSSPQTNVTNLTPYTSRMGSNNGDTFMNVSANSIKRPRNENPNNDDDQQYYCCNNNTINNNNTSNHNNNNNHNTCNNLNNYDADVDDRMSTSSKKHKSNNTPIKNRNGIENNHVALTNTQHHQQKIIPVIQGVIAHNTQNHYSPQNFLQTYDQNYVYYDSTQTRKSFNHLLQDVKVISSNPPLFDFNFFKADYRSIKNTPARLFKPISLFAPSSSTSGEPSQWGLSSEHIAAHELVSSMDTFKPTISSKNGQSHTFSTYKEMLEAYIIQRELINRYASNSNLFNDAGYSNNPWYDTVHKHYQYNVVKNLHTSFHQFWYNKAYSHCPTSTFIRRNTNNATNDGDNGLDLPLPNNGSIVNTKTPINQPNSRFNNNYSNSYSNNNNNHSNNHVTSSIMSNNHILSHRPRGGSGSTIYVNTSTTLEITNLPKSPGPGLGGINENNSTVMSDGATDLQLVPDAGDEMHQHPFTQAQPYRYVVDHHKNKVLTAAHYDLMNILLGLTENQGVTHKNQRQSSNYYSYAPNAPPPPAIGPNIAIFNAYKTLTPSLYAHLDYKLKETNLVKHYGFPKKQPSTEQQNHTHYSASASSRHHHSHQSEEMVAKSVHPFYQNHDALNTTYIPTITNYQPHRFTALFVAHLPQFSFSHNFESRLSSQKKAITAFENAQARRYQNSDVFAADPRPPISLQQIYAPCITENSSKTQYNHKTGFSGLNIHNNTLNDVYQSLKSIPKAMEACYSPKRIPFFPLKVDMFIHLALLNYKPSQQPLHKLPTGTISNATTPKPSLQPHRSSQSPISPSIKPPLADPQKFKFLSLSYWYDTIYKISTLLTLIPRQIETEAILLSYRLSHYSRNNNQYYDLQRDLLIKTVHMSQPKATSSLTSLASIPSMSSRLSVIDSNGSLNNNISQVHNVFSNVSSVTSMSSYSLPPPPMFVTTFKSTNDIKYYKNAFYFQHVSSDTGPVIAKIKNYLIHVTPLQADQQQSQTVSQLSKDSITAYCVTLGDRAAQIYRVLDNHIPATKTRIADMITFIDYFQHLAGCIHDELNLTSTISQNNLTQPNTLNNSLVSHGSSYVDNITPGRGVNHTRNRSSAICELSRSSSRNVHSSNNFDTTMDCEFDLGDDNVNVFSQQLCQQQSLQLHHISHFSVSVETVNTTIITKNINSTLTDTSNNLLLTKTFHSNFMNDDSPNGFSLSDTTVDDDRQKLPNNLNINDGHSTNGYNVPNVHAHQNIDDSDEGEGVQNISACANQICNRNIAHHFHNPPQLAQNFPPRKALHLPSQQPQSSLVHLPTMLLDNNHTSSQPYSASNRSNGNNQNLTCSFDFHGQCNDNRLNQHSCSRTPPLKDSYYPQPPQNNSNQAHHNDHRLQPKTISLITEKQLHLSPEIDSHYYKLKCYLLELMNTHGMIVYIAEQLNEVMLSDLVFKYHAYQHEYSFSILQSLMSPRQQPQQRFRQQQQLSVNSPQGLYSTNILSSVSSAPNSYQSPHNLTVGPGPTRPLDFEKDMYRPSLPHFITHMQNILSRPTTVPPTSTPNTNSNTSLNSSHTFDVSGCRASFSSSSSAAATSPPQVNPWHQITIDYTTMYQQLTEFIVDSFVIPPDNSYYSSNNNPIANSPGYAEHSTQLSPVHDCTD